MDKIRTVGQKWLVNERVLFLWTLKKWTKAQSNLMILSKVIAVTDDVNEKSVKPVFSHSGGFKTWRFDENWGVGGGLKFYTNLIPSLMRM